jgi:acetylornithine deacetylase
MKGFIAAALAVVPRAVEADLQAPLWLGLTCDEEVGALGAGPLADALLAQLNPPAWAVVGEATGMQVVRAHKGVRVLRTTVVGRDAHSSQPGLGASAVMGAARVVTRIEEVADALREGALQDDRFDPPHTTMNVGLVHGGTALNIIPRTCEVTW